jgi:acid stress chaperone HdeA
MYLQRSVMGIVTATLLVGSPSVFGQSPANKKPLDKMTCEEFVGLDDTFRPRAVYWAVAHGADGKEAGGVSVEGIEKVVPVVVEACKKTPKESFWQRVKAEFKNLKQKL